MSVWLGGPLGSYVFVRRGSSPVTTGNYFNAVTQGGINNSGSGDQTAGILAAVTAYKNGGYDGLYFPQGVYQMTTNLTLPDGTVLCGPPVEPVALGLNGSGCQTPLAHLRGRINFGTYCTLRDLHIGEPDRAALVVTHDLVHDTSFTRCQFRGGGHGRLLYDSRSEEDCKILKLSLGGGRNGRAYNLTWTDCNFEANAGTVPGNNAFGIVAAAPATDGASTMHDILFRGCHFGIANAAGLTGSPHFYAEYWCENPWDLATGTTYEHSHTLGYHDFNFEDCVFEPLPACCLDFVGVISDASSTTGLAGYSHITGCIFKGNGLPGYIWNNDIVAECGARNIEVYGNTFYRGGGCAFVCSPGRYDPTTLAYNTFHDNQVLATDAYLNTGITHVSNQYVGITGVGCEVKDNVIISDKENPPLMIEDAQDSTVTGNEITVGPGTWDYWAIDLKGTSDYNVITGNTSHNASQAVIRDQSTGTHNVLTPNTLG